MCKMRSLIYDPVVRFSLILICLDLLLLLFLSAPMIVTQTLLVVFPLFLAFFSGLEMYNKNDQKWGEALLYGGGALLFFASVELIIVFFLLQFSKQTDVFTNLMSNLQGLAFPIALFGLALSITSGVERSVSIRKDLSQIKECLGIQDSNNDL